MSPVEDVLVVGAGPARSSASASGSCASPFGTESRSSRGGWARCRCTRCVELADGQRLDADVVVCATGYRPGLEPLVGHLDVLDDRGRPVAVPGPVSGWPGQWFAGQRPPFHGNLHGRGPEARRLAARIRRRRERSGPPPASTGPGTLRGFARSPAGSHSTGPTS